MFGEETEKYTGGVRCSMVGEAEFFYGDGDSVYCIFSRAAIRDSRLISAARKEMTDVKKQCQQSAPCMKGTGGKADDTDTLSTSLEKVCVDEPDDTSEGNKMDGNSTDEMLEQVKGSIPFDDGEDSEKSDKTVGDVPSCAKQSKSLSQKSRALRNDAQYLWLVGLKFDEYWKLAGQYIINASWLSTYGSGIEEAARQNFEVETLRSKPKNLLKCHRSLVDYENIVYKSNPSYQPTSWEDLFMMHSYAVKELAKKDFCKAKKSSALDRSKIFIENAKLYGFVPGFEMSGISESDDTSTSSLSTAFEEEEGQHERGDECSSSKSACESSSQETSKQKCDEFLSAESCKTNERKRRGRELVNYNGMEMFDDVYADFYGHPMLTIGSDGDLQKIKTRRKNSNSNKRTMNLPEDEKSPEDEVLTPAEGDAANVENYKDFDFGFDERRDGALVAKNAFSIFKNDNEMRKYWVQRYRLFSKINEGILMDREGWFSVTPEAIAKNIANRVVLRRGAVVVDAFAGVGGNSIQMALNGAYVIAIDLNPIRIRCAIQNAKVYGVADRINFICADFFHFAEKYSTGKDATDSTSPFDAVFLSPPWGGPSYLNTEVFDLNSELTPNGFEIFSAAKMLSPNIAYFLPRHTSVKQLISLAGKGGSCEIEQNLFNKKVKSVTAYYGDLILK